MRMGGTKNGTQRVPDDPGNDPELAGAGLNALGEGLQIRGRAWWHIETMNRLAKRPLVETAVGGKGGGGARLTAEGEEAVRLYRALDGRAKAFEGHVKVELGG
jgi:molybdate transport system regulatory protein